jgi:tetratricopeptide (TPR) repeat protein
MKSTHRQLFTLACAGIAYFGSAHVAFAQASPNLDFWSDPQFVNAFMGSYGFLSPAEPPVSDAERTTLRSLVDMIQANPRVAAQQLRGQITDTSTAAFDFILGNLLFQEGDLAGAEQSYRNALRKFPSFRRALKNISLVLVQRNDFEAAIPFLSRAIEMGEMDGRIFGLLGYAYLLNRSYYPAEVAYRQAILMQPKVTDWRVGLARTLIETENYRDAAALFETLLQDDPDNGQFILLQANAFIGLNEPMRAAENIEVARRMGSVDQRSLTLLGDIYLNNDAPGLALDAYTAILDEADEPKPLVRAAELFTRSGAHDEATALIARTRDRFGESLDPKSAFRLLTLEAQTARARGDTAAAERILTEIVERDVLNGDALIELGNLYADQGDLARATLRFEQAVRISGHERAALIAHARILVGAGRFNEALPMLRRALQIEFDRNLQDYADRVERAARGRTD